MNMELLSSESGSAVCELCHHHQPSFYCSSDSAFLCSHCDSQVHSANFLVARHIRMPLTKSSSSSSSSESSSESSTTNTHDDHTTTTTTTKSKANKADHNKSSDWKTRDLLLNWCTKLGLELEVSVQEQVIEVAKHAFQMSRGVVIYRLALAASLWLGVLTIIFTKDDIDDHHHHHHVKKKKKTTTKMMMRKIVVVKRLEEISGVPANSILMLAKSKLFKFIMNHHHHHHVHVEEEAWAES